MRYNDDMLKRVTLKQAVKELYFAGLWKCDVLDEAEQVRLWEQLRDAASLKKGTATKNGVGKV